MSPALGARPVSVPGISAERPAALALRADRFGYGEYRVAAGRLEARLTLEDAATGKMGPILTASADSLDVVAVATALARQISDRAAAYRVRNPEALRHYAQALEPESAAGAVQHLERAVAADPDFAPPYRFLAELKAQVRDLPGALQVLEAAAARGTAIDQGERMRMDILRATLRADRDARHRALEALAAAEPRDPSTWQALAESALARQSFQQAVQAYRNQLQIEPSDANSWNQLGYAAAYAGDPGGAMDALRRYQALRPDDPNPVDSMGDVNLVAGRLAEAEKFYLEAARKNPSFLDGAGLFKAAMARLMTGDVAGADALANRYIEARTKARDPLAEFRRAEWTWVSGRRRAAIQQLESLAAARELAPRAYSQVAIWRLMLGERDLAGKAIQQAGGPAASRLADFLAQPPAPPAEWVRRAEAAFPETPQGGGVRDLMIGYALLFARDFQSASTFLSRFSGINVLSGDPVPPAALAWTQVETGRAKDAAATLRFNPIPQPAGPGAFSGFYFPRLYYLRAVLAQQQGRAGEARSNYRLFLQLSGPDPLQWGEEEKARATVR